MLITVHFSYVLGNGSKLCFPIRKRYSYICSRVIYIVVSGSGERKGKERKPKIDSTVVESEGGGGERCW